MITELITALGIMFQWRDVQCLLFVILTVPGLLGPPGVCGAPPQCPPGGRYFDKNLGQWGRYACCSELCEPPGLFQDQCSKKCPNYEKDKYVEDSPPVSDSTSPSTLALYFIIPVAVLLLLLVFVIRIRRVRDRGWRGLLPAIFLQRAAPGVRYSGGNVVLPGDTPPPRTPAEDDDVEQNLLDDPEPEDDDVEQNPLDNPQPEDDEAGRNPLDNPEPEDDDVGQNLLDNPQPEDDEAGRKLLADPQPQERVGGACGGPARDGEFCQTAKTEAPPIQVEEQDQKMDQPVAMY